MSKHFFKVVNLISVLGGWNNNPSVTGFQSIFRKLVTWCGVHPGNSGNSKPLDKTTAILASTSYIPPFSQEDNADIFIHDELKPAEKVRVLAGPVLGNVVYISRWVVRKSLRKVTCLECRQALVNKECCSLKYGRLKNYCMLKTMVGLLYLQMELLPLVYALKNT